MRTEQNRWTEVKGWEPEPPGELGESAQLVLLFGSTSILEKERCLGEIKDAYPKGLLVGCSTAGEISPFTPGARCSLHNQTMTITTLSEK